MNIGIELQVGTPALILEGTFDVPTIADALAAMKRANADSSKFRAKVFVRFNGVRYTFAQALRVEKIQNSAAFNRAGNRAQLAAA